LLPPPSLPPSADALESSAGEAISTAAIVASVVGSALAALITGLVLRWLRPWKRLGRSARSDASHTVQSTAADVEIDFADLHRLTLLAEETQLAKGGMSVYQLAEHPPRDAADAAAGRERMQGAFERALASLGGKVQPMAYGKFGGEIRWMTTGKPVEAALGLHRFLGVSESHVALQLVDPVGAIEAEVKAHGTDDDRYCLHYVLREAAGTSERQWPNGVLDDGRHGERFADFVAHPNAHAAGLDAGHVLALRLYTTAAYKSLNEPLRDRSRTQPHPFPCTILKLSDAIKKLRAIEALGKAGANDMEGSSSATNALQTVDLFRGMRDTAITAEFERVGGTEVHPLPAPAPFAPSLSM
jgi:hypothetical protein